MLIKILMLMGVKGKRAFCSEKKMGKEKFTNISSKTIGKEVGPPFFSLKA